MKIKIQYILTMSALSLTLCYGTFAQTTTQSQKFGANPTLIAPSAVLEIESTNKGVLFPRVTLSSTSDVTTIASPATGLTVFNTASAGTSPNNVTPGYYYWNGSKWVKMAVETPFAKTVYVNATSPSTATIFDENNPPVTNDDALKTTDVNLYIGNNGSTWTYNTSTSTYNTFIVPPSTPFNLAGTTTDAGSNKIGAIERVGSISVTNGFLRASGNSNSFTMDPTQGGGPRLMLGPTATPNGFFELGAYNGMNNFDTKARDFNIFSTATANALVLKHNTGNVGLGINAPAQRLDVNGSGLFRRGNSTGSTFNQILFSFNSGSSYQHAIKTRHAGGTAQGNAIDFYIWTNAVAETTVGSRHLMSLEGQGRVGIGGITNPTAVIDASSTSVAIATINADRKMLRLSIPRADGVKTENVAEFNMGSYAVLGTSARTRLDLLLNDGLDNTVSQVMTWQANGNVGIGTTAPSQRLHIKGNNAQPATTGSVSNAIVRIDGSSSHALDIGTFTNVPYGSYLQSVTTSDLAAKLPLVLNPTGGNVGIGINNPAQALQVVGNIAASGTVSASGTTLTSDARLKSNVVRIKNGLITIMQLNPVNYDKKIALDSAATANENGFIAQELQKIMPELVSEGKDNDKLLSINYTAIIPVLTKAVQEQQAIIEKQQMQINELKALLEKVLNDK